MMPVWVRFTIRGRCKDASLHGKSKTYLLLGKRTVPEVNGFYAQVVDPESQEMTDIGVSEYDLLEFLGQAILFGKCPVCGGRGKMPPGFYGGSNLTTDATEEACRSCRGLGYVMEKVEVPV